MMDVLNEMNDSIHLLDFCNRENNQELTVFLLIFEKTFGLHRKVAKRPAGRFGRFQLYT